MCSFLILFNRTLRADITTITFTLFGVFSITLATASPWLVAPSIAAVAVMIIVYLVMIKKRLWVKDKKPYVLIPALGICVLSGELVPE